MRESRCCVCGENLEGIISCPKCLASIHSDCKKYAGSCVTMSCPGEGVEDHLPDAAKTCAVTPGSRSSPSLFVDAETDHGRSAAFSRAATYRIHFNSAHLWIMGKDPSPGIGKECFAYYMAALSTSSQFASLHPNNKDALFFLARDGENQLLRARAWTALGRFPALTGFTDYQRSETTTAAKEQRGLSLYTASVDDLLTAQRSEDAITIAKESGDHPLHKRASFAAGMRNAGSGNYHLAWRSFFLGDHHDLALDAFFLQTEFDGKQILEVYHAHRGVLSDPVIVNEAKLALDFANRLIGKTVKEAHEGFRPGLNYFLETSYGLLTQAVQILDFQQDTSRREELGSYVESKVRAMAGNEYVEKLKATSQLPSASPDTKRLP